jgi:ATP-dependent exoDNAse (exonuclease V) alpha subunit
MLTQQSLKQPVLAATTNKAAKVLADLSGVQAKTIHSVLGLKVKNDFKTGRTRLETTHPKDAFKTPNLYVIDEASMVNMELFNMIRYYLEDSSKILFIGDSYQLPPVMEKKSIVFQEVKYRAELKGIQRQALDSNIITQAHKFRQVIDDDFANGWPEIDCDGTEVIRVTGPEMKSLLEQRFKQDPSREDLRVLAYRNAQVLKYNQFIRSQYTASTHFVPGEKVLANKPVLDDGVMVYPTDSVVEITNVVPATSADGIKGYNIELDHFYDTFQAENPNAVKALAKQYAQAKDWGNFFRVKDEYADLRPLHAQTCHKAQGSTYSEVFIDLNDIGTNRKWQEVARLVYVAITRASDRVFIYGDLPQKK